MAKISFLMVAAFTVALFVRPNEIYHDLNITGLHRVLGIAALIACLFSLRGRIFSIFKQRISIFISIYFFAIFISIPFSLWPGGSVDFLAETLLKQAAILFVMVIALKNERQLAVLPKLIAYSSSIVAAYTIVRYAGGVDLTEGYRASLVQGVFSDPNDLALHFVYSVPFAYFLMYRSAKRKWLPVLIMTVLSISVLLTFSRGGMLGLCAVTAAIWYFDRERRKINSIVLMVVLFIAVLSFPASLDRFSTLVEYDSKPEASMMQRWHILKEGLQTFIENPLVGVGVKSFSIAEGRLHGEVGEWKDAHNSFIQIAAETGILGLIGFAGCLYLILKSLPVDAHAEPKMYYLQSGIRSSAIGYLVCGSFLSQAYSWYFFYLLGFAILFQSLESSENYAE